MQTDKDALLEVRGLCKTVQSGGKPLDIVRDVSFDVRSGERVAIVGASGSGKSTLLALLAGMDTPSRGTVRLGGELLNDLDEDGRAKLRARMIGFVFQSFQLLPNLTALENVMLPLELSGSGATECRQLATEWLNKVGLAARMSHYPVQLSGGEQQRVALARAFAPQPTLLFADEPTGNLDAATGSEVIDLVLCINEQQATTFVLVTHDENIASRSGKILYMNEGGLTTSPPAECN